MNPVAELKDEAGNPPDRPIATFITNHNALAHIIETGPSHQRMKIVHFTFSNGDTHQATMGAVLVLRELCDQIIRNCGTDILVPRTEPAPTKE